MNVPWLGVAAAVAVSPVLASWSAALADDQWSGWWRPRPVGVGRWALVAGVSVLLVAASAAGNPAAGWWVLATGGTVLAVVDARTHRLPARFTHPWAAVIAAVLGAAALTSGDGAGLVRAAAAAAAVWAGWMVVRFASPSAVGQGDVRTVAVAAGLLGYTGWAPVVQAQPLILLAAAVTAVILRLTRGALARGDQIPMGPAIITGAVLTLWL